MCRSGTFSRKRSLESFRSRERERREAFLERNALTPEGSGNALYAGRKRAFRVSCFLLPSLFSYTLSQRFCEETWYGVAQNMCASVLRSAGKEERGLKLI
jgi:hypothetical protein